jgi:ATP-binding cassette subfamily F protein 3
MSLLTVEHLRHSFKDVLVLEDVNLTVNAGERVGLVGRNGSGKTTLLRLIAGEDTPDGGAVRRLPTVRVGYLEQEGRFAPGKTLWEAIHAGFERLETLRRQLAALEARMERPDGEDVDALLEEYGRRQHEYEAAGGYEFDTRARTVLFGLGLKEEDLTKPTSVLSGGQQTRAHLAKLLLEEPDLLLLDEPTNHLDLYATEWLEEFLGRWQGAVLLVSHDRFFLDALATKIVELRDGTATTTAGNYTAFESLKAAAVAQQRKLYEQQQEQIRKLEEYIRRYKAGNRATMAKSREKALARIQRIDRPRGETRGPSIRFQTEAAGGLEALRVRELTKRFGERTLFENVTLTILRGERWGVVGPNGSGKSTLLKTMLGIEPPTEGRVEWGYRIEPGYFAQDLGDLDEELTVLDEVLGTADITIPEARSLLGRFLFTEEEVFKQIKVLSGGEKNRVSLVKLFLQKPNFLVLDEPTNHLDLVACTGLEEAILAYPGSVLIASHDRRLLERTATGILEVTGGRVTPFPGTYREWRESKERALRAAQAPPPKKATPKAESAPVVKRRGLRAVEGEIANLEARLAELSARLADPAAYADGDLARRLTSEYEEESARLDEVYTEWERLAEEAAERDLERERQAALRRRT